MQTNNIQLNRCEECRTFSLNVTVPVRWKSTKPDFQITQQEILDATDDKWIEKTCQTMMNNPLICTVFVSNKTLLAVHDFRMSDIAGHWMYRVTILVEFEVSYQTLKMKHWKELQKSVDTLELTTRTWNCLNRLSIEYIYELVTWSPDRLLKTKHFGRKSLNEVIELLAEIGLTLDMNLGETK